MKKQNSKSLRNLYKTWSDVKLIRAATLHQNEYEDTAIEMMQEEIKSRNLSISDSNIGLKSMIINRIHGDVADLLIEPGDGTLLFNPTSEDGFPIELLACGDDIMISSFLWHEHFENIDNAIELFIKMLSEKCRMRYEYRGKILYKMVLEIEHDDGWLEMNATVILFFPFWMKKRVEYKQNNVIKT